MACALSRGTPDRLPVMELAIDWKVMAGLGYRDYFDMIEGLELDVVPVDQVLYLMGARRFLSRWIRTYRDEWGVIRRFTDDLLPIPVRHPIRSEEDLASFRPPDPSRNPILGAIARVRKRVKDRPLLMMARADFAASWYLAGMENLLVSYVTRPEFALKLAEIVSTYAAELFALAVTAGVEIIVLTDDYAHKSGPIMSPEHFRTFVLPGLRKAVRAVKALGAFCIKHTDGNIWSIIDPIVETGIDALGPLEPGAGMDLREVKRRYGSRVAVVGNVDVDLLSRGSREEVIAAVTGLIRDVSAGGGHILSSGNTIAASVRPDNYRAMLETARLTGGRAGI
jgi:uroporphyrinogen decarboxylase